MLVEHGIFQNERVVRRTILLVDDSRADVELVKYWLGGRPGAPRLIVAQDGVEALRMLRENSGTPRPDLILLDLNLPLKPGHRVLAEIKQDPQLRHIPVVILSSSSAERDIASAYELHANCYLTKPMDIDSFADALRSIEEFWFSRAQLPSPGV
jgi:two-component system, chemotaxis family, response regulator Rcp1